MNPGRFQASRPRARALLYWLVIPLIAAAIPELARAADQRISLRIGQPPTAAVLHARSGPDGFRLEVRGAGAPVRAVFPASAGASVEVDSRRLANGAEVAVVRVTDGAARWAALVTARRGRPLLLWQGRLDLAGDPGERRGASIELEDRTGDGVPDVVVGTVREDTYVCGAGPALLDTRAVHPDSLELRPVVLRRLPELPPDGEREVAARADSPGPAERPLVDALHFRRASSVAGRPAGTSVVPGGLGDGDPTTAWVEGAGTGTFEFATAAWAGGAGLPIRAFSIVPRPSGALEASTRMPSAIWLVGDRGPRLRVALPRDARPGQRFWVVPAEPLPWSCVSVVLDGSGADASGSTHLALAELEAYSEVDFGGGIPHLVSELSATASRADRAEALLAQLGQPALEALDAAFADMPEQERIRAVRAVARMVRTLPAAKDSLGRAVLAPEREVSVEARRALIALGPEGARTLASVAAGEPTGAALMELAERYPELALEPTLVAMEASGGTERAVLRQVLARCAREAPEPTRLAIEARLGGAPAVLASFSEALAAAGPAGRPSAMRSIEAAVERVDDFPSRFRVARAARVLAQSGLPPQVASFLERQARGAEEWMMRAEAIRALAALDPAPVPLLLSALSDPYPRVRLAAVESLGPRLGASTQSAVKIAELARRDPFPLVRAGAVAALASLDAARPVVEAGLQDRAERVRAAAVEAFAARGDSRAWPRVEQRIRDEDEWPVVTDAAIAYAKRLCIEDSVPALEIVVARARRPRAWDPDLTSAGFAIEALAALGTPAARAALTAAAARQDDAVGRTAAHALERPATCGGMSPQASMGATGRPSIPPGP